MTFKEVLDYSVGSLTVGKILVAVITFVVGYIVIKLITGAVNKLIEKTSLDGTLQKYLKLAVKLILFFILTVMTVDALGISPTSLIWTNY